MSGQSAAVENAAKIIAPYSTWVQALYTSGAAASQDLSLCGQITVDPGALVDIYAPQMFMSNTVTNPNFVGFLGRYIRFYAVSSAVWVAFGATLAAVTGGNAPVIPTGTSSIINTATTPWPIASGTYQDFYITTNTRFIGYIGASAGFLMAVPSSVGANG